MIENLAGLRPSGKGLRPKMGRSQYVKISPGWPPDFICVGWWLRESVGGWKKIFSIFLKITFLGMFREVKRHWA